MEKYPGEIGKKSNRLEQINFLMYGILPGYLLQTGQPTFPLGLLLTKEKKKTWGMDPGIYGYLSGDNYWSSGLSEQ